MQVIDQRLQLMIGCIQAIHRTDLIVITDTFLTVDDVSFSIAVIRFNVHTDALSLLFPSIIYVCALGNHTGCDSSSHPDSRT